MAEIIEMKSEDVLIFENTLNNFIETNNITLQQHQFDMLLSLSFQYGQNTWTKDTTLPNYLIEGNGNYDSVVMESIYELYGGGEGGKYESRRSRELHVFFNGYGN